MREEVPSWGVPGAHSGPSRLENTRGGGQTLVEPSVHTLGREAGTGEGEEPKVAHTLCRGCWPADRFNWATL